MNVPRFNRPLLAALVATHAAAFLIGYAVWPSPSAASPTPANVPAAVAETSHQGRPKRDSRPLSDKRITDFPAELALLSQAEMSREEFVKARDELLVKWMQRDLGAMMDWCYGSAATPIRWDSIGCSGALWRQIASQGSEVMQWIKAGRFGSNRQAVFSQWCAALRANGKGELYFSEMPNMTLSERVWLISNHAFNELDLPGLTAFRDELGRYAAEDSRDGDHLLMMYACRLVELSWENPAAVFQGESDPALLRHLGRTWADKRFGRDPDPEKLSDITQLPPAARAGVLDSVLNSADERGVGGVLPVFKELARLECWEDLSGEEAARAMRDVAALGRDAALALTKWVATLDHLEARKALTTAAARGFVAKDEKGCLEWLTAMPSGSELDATIASLTSDYVGTREFKLGLLEKVHDPALAARLIASDSRLRSADGAR